MSGGTTDWTLIVMASQKAQVAAEGALASFRLLKSEVGLRLASIEARMTGVEGRLTTLAAGQQGHELAIMRLADTLADHTGRLTRIEARLGDADRQLGDIDRRLGDIDGRLSDADRQLGDADRRLVDIDGRLGGIEAALAAIAARLP